MSLAGTLDELALPDILQIVSLAEKTGRLRLTAKDGEGLIVFRRGRIIYAASNSAREAFGSILMGMKLVDEVTLRRALERQHRSHEERRLGRILVEMGALKLADLERVVQRQVQRVVGELFGFREGYFKFEPLDIPDRGEVEVDAREFLAEPGLNAHKIAIDLSRMSDESEHRREAPAAGGTAPRDEGEPVGAGCERATLQAIIADRTVPSFTGEVTAEILRTSSSVLARGLLMLVESLGISGIGQFGLPGEEGDANERARGLWLPLDEPSLMTEVVRSGHAYVGPLPRLRLHELLVALLEGPWPEQVAVLPLASHGRVKALLYGDNQPTGVPLPAADRLERLSGQIGEAISRATPAPSLPARP